MPKFTSDQQKAIDVRGSNLLVSAAAGSGKTAVLVERILSLVREGSDISSFLVMTYTNAAAAELRERLSGRLEEMAQESQAMATQFERLPLSTISTIHAFCKAALDRYFDRAGLEAGFRVCEDEESQQLFMEALEDTLDEKLMDDAFAQQLLPIGSLDRIRTEVRELYGFLMSQPKPLAWLGAALDEYALHAQNPESSPWIEELRQKGNAELEVARRQVLEAKRICDTYGSGYEPCVLSDLQLLEEIADGSAAACNFARLPSIRAANKTDWDEAVKALREIYKEPMKRAYDALRPVTDLQKMQMQRMEEPLRALGELTKGVMEAFTQLKREAGVVDFSDLEHLTLLLLGDSMVCQSIADRYDHIFVDEYQDSSAVQEAIIRLIEHGNNRFMVGDVKQSIYRFRQAEPSIFLTHQQSYGRGEGGTLVALNRNFRSNKGILHAVNHVFSHAMRERSMEIEYDTQAMLYEGRDLGDANPVTLSIVSPEDSEGGTEPINALAAEASQVAALVERALGLFVREGEGHRKAEYRDIVILLRSPRSQVQQYLDALSLRGIPAYAQAAGGYFETVEMIGAVDYLSAVDNPRKDIPLMGAMRSVGGFSAQELAQIRLFTESTPFFSRARLYAQGGRDKKLRAKLLGFIEEVNAMEPAAKRELKANARVHMRQSFGFAADELAQIGETEKKLPFYSCVKLYARDGEDEALRGKTEAFISFLWELRGLSRQMPVSKIVQMALEETGYLSASMALPGAKTREANLRALIHRAKGFDGANYTLSDFLRALKAARSHGRDGDTPTLTDNDNVVRIMSVHKSKGLEFPIVIGAGLAREFQTRSMPDSMTGVAPQIVLDKELGIGFPFLDPDLSVKAETLSQRAIQLKKRRQLYAEELRILYVLMTRPKDHLLLSAYIKKPEEQCALWAQGPVLEPKCFMDFIGPAVIRHGDAQALRALCGAEVPACEDSSNWHIQLQRAAGAGERVKGIALRDLIEKLEGQIVDVVERAGLFTLDYAYQIKEEGPQKQSVLEETQRGERDVDYIHSRPDFMRRQAKTLDAAEIGTAVHAALSLLDLDAVRGLSEGALSREVQRQVQQFADRELIDAAQAKAVDPAMVCRFLEGPLGRAMLSSQTVLREHPFVLRKADGGLVQGIIDLCFKGLDGGYTLVDFKTDRRNLDDKSVIARHGPQLKMYAGAMRKAGLFVRKSIVYLFATGKTVEIKEENPDVAG